jgi:hypothetical protein
MVRYSSDAYIFAFCFHGFPDGNVLQLHTYSYAGVLYAVQEGVMWLAYMYMGALRFPMGKKIGMLLSAQKQREKRKEKKRREKRADAMRVHAGWSSYLVGGLQDDDALICRGVGVKWRAERRNVPYICMSIITHVPSLGKWYCVSQSS